MISVNKEGLIAGSFRYDNALIDGLTTSTGQRLAGVGIQACLDAIKDDFHNAKYAGLATGIKNSGVGNGMNDESKVIIEVVSDKKNHTTAWLDRNGTRSSQYGITNSL